MTGKIVALLIGMPPALGRDAFAGVRERGGAQAAGLCKAFAGAGAMVPHGGAGAGVHLKKAPRPG